MGLPDGKDKRQRGAGHDVEMGAVHVTRRAAVEMKTKHFVSYRISYFLVEAR
jgi:hypothetical protein